MNINMKKVLTQILIVSTNVFGEQNLKWRMR